MKISNRILALAFVASALAAPAHAQFGNLGGMIGGGGAKSAGADPAKIEQDLKSIVETTSIAMAKFSSALGMKEQAATFEKNATCIKDNSCGLSDSINVIQTESATVLAEADKRKASGQKLDANAGAEASAALVPALKAFPLWKQVIDGARGMDKMAAVKFAGLVQAAPKVPAAAKNTVDVINGGISFLAFSGVDTTSLKSEAAASMKF